MLRSPIVVAALPGAHGETKELCLPLAQRRLAAVAAYTCLHMPTHAYTILTAAKTARINPDTRQHISYASSSEAAVSRSATQDKVTSFRRITNWAPTTF